MKMYSPLLLLFAAVSAYADDLSAPTVTSVLPVFSYIVSDPIYHNATIKAQDAFLAQVGFTQQYSKTTTTATRSIAAFIDNDTPLNSKAVFFVMGTAYAAGIKKQVSRSFKAPFFPSVTGTVTVGKSVQSIGFKIPF